MRLLLLLPVLLTACKSAAESPPTTAATPPAASQPAPAVDLKSSVVRLNSTVQPWNPAQPWEKAGPSSRRALAAIVGPSQVLTTADMVANATYLELESPDGSRFAPARVIAVDYETNLALLAPASAAEGDKLFAATRPVEIAAPAKTGDPLTIYQIEENGVELRTAGVLQSVDIQSSFLPSQAFLTYQVKASMQSAASSYSLPVFTGEKLTGVLYSYNSKDQICDISATDILARFLKAAATESYVGAPSLGVSCATTEDPAFRRWLKLTDDQGGLYLSSVRKGYAAAAAGMKKGDVLLAVDDHAIDRRGYFQHPSYGSLSWGHLVRGDKAVGDTVTLALIRAGEPLELKATLAREEEWDKLVPNYTFDRAPDYLVKGGFIFQELSLPLLESFGENWTSRAPLNLLDVYENPEKYEDKSRRIVFLSGVIPTPATVGYEPLRNLIVRQVNGVPIRDLKSLVEAFKANPNPLHSIQFDQDDFTIHLDEAVSSQVDAELLQRGIPILQRLTETP
ncbi:MAG: PDZ domain-containing protein [Akkermansiaceae bacterium]|nr:PDZ domain-containing protein [Akkermansiaceae bacterium]